MTNQQLVEQPTARSPRKPLPELCPDGHVIGGIGIFCRAPRCRRFILLAPDVYQAHSVSTYVNACLLIPASLAAILLSRFTDSLWPLYMFFMFGVVLVYATIFSRGRALTIATWILGGTIGIWLGLEVSSRLLGLSPPHLPNAAVLVLPPAIYVLFAGCMAYVGQRLGFDAVRRSATYFLTTGALTFGFWGVWLVYLEENVVTLGLYQLAIGIGLVLPVGSVSLLAGRTSWDGWKTKAKQEKSQELLDLVANSLVVVAGYILLMEPVIQVLAFLLGRFIPQAVGREPLPDVNVHFLGGPGWRAVLTSALLMIAITLVAVRSTLQVTAEVANERLGTMQTPDLLVSMDTKMLEAGFAGNLYGRIGIKIIQNLFITVRHFFRVAAPVTMFSVLSVTVILVLGVMQDYRGHGAFFATLSLWGIGLTAWIVVVLACGLAFWAAREHTPPPAPQASEGETPAKPPRRFTLSLVETGSSSLLGGLLYFLLSLVSLALLPLWLYPQDSSQTFDGFVPGDIFFINLFLSMGALLALVALTLGFRMLPTGKKKAGVVSGTGSEKGPVIGYALSACVLLILVGVAVYFAEPPVRVASAYAASHPGPVNQEPLRGQVPDSIEASCVRDQIMLTGYLAGLRCQTADANTQVSYHLFDSPQRLDQWYAEALANRDITPGQGECASAAIAETSYTIGTRQGRVACASGRAGSWLIWTEAGSRVMGIARSTQRNSTDLYAFWREGKI